MLIIVLFIFYLMLDRCIK